MELSLLEVQRLLESNWPTDTLPEIMAYSQRDERWRNDLMMTVTIGGYGCAMTCCAMLASQFDPNITPQTLNKFLRNNGGYTSDNRIYWSKVSELIPQLKYETYVKWTYTPADVDFVLSEIDKQPVILQVDFKPQTVYPDMHFVLAIAHNTSDIEIIDPWDGSKTKLLERYALDNWDLKRAIYSIVIYEH